MDKPIEETKGASIKQAKADKEVLYYGVRFAWRKIW